MTAVLAIAGLGACASKPKQPVVPPKPVGTGVMVPLQIQGQGARTSEGFQFFQPYFFLTQGTRKLVYSFGFRVLDEGVPVRVRVEDLSEGGRKPIIEDSRPQLDESHQWRGNSREYSLGDDGTEWLATPDVSVREYLFIVELKDGRLAEQRIRSVDIPAYVKDGMRKQMTGR